jgi:hypothetical protein
MLVMVALASGAVRSTPPITKKTAPMTHKIEITWSHLIKRDARPRWVDASVESVSLSSGDHVSTCHHAIPNEPKSKTVANCGEAHSDACC